MKRVLPVILLVGVFLLTYATVYLITRGSVYGWLTLSLVFLMSGGGYYVTQWGKDD